MCLRGKQDGIVELGRMADQECSQLSNPPSLLLFHLSPLVEHLFYFISLISAH
jgi:hypothetical protein